jgi:AcrR family transcriptional regulator
MTENRTRPYRKHRRAELEHLTRERIVEAAVELHGSVGPARTTVSGVARRAGVQRATVYRHFPDEESLFAACSALWAERNAPPDLAGWAAVRDPDARLALGLAELYAWFGRTEQMIELLNRDAAVLPSMQAQFRQFMAYFDAAADTLLRGRPERGAARRRVRAAVGHAVAFETWRSLVRRQGLTDAEAVALVRAMAGGGPDAP